MSARYFASRLTFSLASGASLKEKLRLAYYAAFKPSLAHRGLADYSEARILSFRIKPRHRRLLDVHVRDNWVGVVTIAEFFSSQSKIIPTNLPPFHPKVIYDLGANVGIASLYFSSLHPEATVYGFEPVPENLEVCALNYRSLPSPSRVYPWAVGAQSGTAVFDCKADSRGGRLASSAPVQGLKTVQKIEVQVYSISDLVTGQGLLPPDFLKVDVEGAEMEVLNGLGEFHRDLKCVYVETHGSQLKRECLEWMERHRFKTWPGADETAIWGLRC